MERTARTTYLPLALDSMVVGMSDAAQVTTADVIRECVHIAQNEPIVRRELLRRLEELRLAKSQQGEYDAIYAAARDAFARAKSGRSC